ncbi:hypothetical protein GQ603_16160 [Clavibacter michiganensis subsp. michiganensis]|uniref:hypothetical protein n=1 Tax=Clavibacter michiganensis TaxID=28447 RepID=UPI00142DA62D|nr:hypothetical protein [Clavibacter michiganensis]NIY62065.1 hypothetical protein [Clavibacter michiganensis subsp. michiganensis]QIT13091.1 hypothetical protein GRD74_16030 [Clavibacter michiganensis subsp. michiganensis]
MLEATSTAAHGGVDGSLIVAVVAAAISFASLGVASLSLARSPRVLWVADLDEISEDDESGPDRSPYIWRMEYSNRGRAIATSVRWRFIFRSGSKSGWSEFRNLAQGEGISLSAGIDASDLLALSDPFKPKVRGPAYELEWRGARESRRPNTRLLYPTERTKMNTG